MATVSDQDIWNFFLNLFGGNEYATAGACGNMKYESGLRTDNCEDKFNDRQNLTDQQVTDLINNGTWNLNHFLYGSNTATSPISGWWVNRYGWGYGLSQWTDTERRTILWNRTRSQGLGIDDVDAQLQYVKWEFTEGRWAGVRDTLMSCTSVEDATRIYCLQYEGGTWKTTRLTYANDFYNNFAGSGTGYQIRLHAEGNCRPFATLHLNDGIDQQIFYAEAGVDVFIHANVGEGDYFTLWTVDSGGVTIDTVTSANTFFTMHANVVDITAHATGTTPPPTPYPPVPPTPILNPKKQKHHMPIWMYPMLR